MRTHQTDEFQSTFAHRIRRSRREIVLAVTLTLAALALVFVAVHGTEETAAVIEPPGKTASQPN